jgi:hypothetical protein
MAFWDTAPHALVGKGRFAPVHAMYRVQVQLHSFLTVAQVDLSSQLHAVNALQPGKNPWYP